MYTFPMTDSDFIIKVQLPNEVLTINLRESMRINGNNLQQEMVEQASWYSFYGTLLADQTSRLAEAKRALTRYKADLSLQIRQGKCTIKIETKKLTEGAINDYLENDRKYATLQDAVDEGERIVAKLDALVKASQQRKDMLVQLCGLARQEMQTFKS